MQPLVTVYITNYNYAKYISQSIESVLGQTMNNFELLIIDDGSTDNSKEIIESYASHPLINIIFQQNKGLNVTNNIAMRAASGKYIMRLDADDYLEQSALEQMSNVLEANPLLGLVFPDYYYVNEAGERTGEERRHNFDAEVSLYDQPAHGACTMIRLDYLKELGGYNESFTCQDGYDLWIKFVTHYKVTNINKPLFSYRRHSSNLTNNESKILATRKQIKASFVGQNLRLPSTLAIIPVRNSFIGKTNWPIYAFQGETMLEKKVRECLLAKALTQIVLSVADDELFEFSSKKFANTPRVIVLKRSKDLAGPNQTLNNTIEHALAELHKRNMEFEAVMSVSLEFPLTRADVIDEAVNTLVLFKSDSVISVRPDTHLYYQHNGHSLKPILDQHKFTRLEREALYKGAGGIVLTTLKNLRDHKTPIAGRVSHVVVDEENAFGVFSEFDLKLLSHYLQVNSSIHA